MGILHGPAQAQQDDASDENTETWRMRPETAQNMRNIIKEETNPVKAKAAFSLGMARIDSAETLKVLRNLLSSDSAPVRASAVYALGRSKEQSATSAVTRMLSDESPPVRVSACRALSELQAENERDQLPLEDNVTRVQIAACRSLSALGCSKTQANKLIKIYQNADNLRLRQTILEILRESHPVKAQDLSGEALESKDIAIRRQALKIIRKLASENVDQTAHLSTIRKQLQVSSPLLRAQACRTLYAIAGKDAKESLVAAMKDKKYRVRQTAATLFKHFACEKPHLEVLHALQGDHNRFVRRAASESLVHMAKRNQQTRDQVLQLALHCLGKKEKAIQCEGLWILGKLRSARAFPRLLKLAKKDFSEPDNSESDSSDASDEEQYKRSRLITWVIKRTEYRKAGDLLIKYSDLNADEYLRVHANRAIGKMKYTEAVPSLSENLLETKMEMGVKFYVYTGVAREQGIWALAQIANQQALETLTSIATTKRPLDSQENIEQACQTLVKNNYTEAAPALKETVTTKSPKGKMPEKIKYLLAQTYEKLTGSSLDVSAPTSEPQYGTFFLNTSTD